MQDGRLDYRKDLFPNNKLVYEKIFINRNNNMKKWYETLFENSAKKYDNERFTKGTIGECDFIEEEIRHDKNLKILDVGCGTGRHAIELTKRGYVVTGIDLSASQIKRAKEKAKIENLDIEFLVEDARQLSFNKKFEMVIMMCEGGFPLMETDEENFDILKGIAQSIKTNGTLIFTTLNGLFPIFNSTNEFTKEKEKENTQFHNNNFDLMTFRDHFVIEFEDDLGNKKEIKGNQRFYIPSEINWLLKSLGFQKVEIFGAPLGQFSRDHKLTTKDFEMLVIANK